MNDKNTGKIIIASKDAFFSPRCCFDVNNPKGNLLPIQKGINVLKCKCGRQYRVEVPTLFTDFNKIQREEIVLNRENATV
jgi:hypothetical protein